MRHRILQVLSYYSPYISGLSEYARILAEGLNSKFDVHILTGKHSRDLKGEETINGVTVHRAAPILFIHKGYLSVEIFSKFRRLSADFDLVHFHLPMLEAGLLSRLVPAIVPIVATYHCDVTMTGGLIDGIATRLVRGSNLACLERCRQIVTTSMDYASGSPLLRRLDGKLVEIHPPSKEFTFRTSPSGGGTDARRIGYLGRFVEEKGIDVLLDSISLVKQAFPDARFVLAGETTNVRGGTTFGKLQNKIAQHRTSIELPGAVDENDLASFYASLDLFVLPSINSYEAFGTTQVEAMKSGVPVVATNMRGVRVPIQMTGNGVLVECGSSEALADGIIRQLRAASPKRDAVRARAYEQFDNALIFRQVTEMYNSVLSAR